MTGVLRNYLLSIVAVALLSGILLSLTPTGPVRRTLRFICGLVLLLAALGPVAKLDMERLAGSLSELRLRAEERVEEAEDGSMELMTALIKEKTEAYIWDKAASLGMTPVRVEAEIGTEGGYPCPRSVAITASCTAAQRRRLTELIERELAVPSSEQEWSKG